MINQDPLQDVFNDCIDRMARGQTIQHCLHIYDQYASELAPMLEAGNLMRRVLPGAEEIEIAKNQVRSRFEEALSEPIPLPVVRTFPLMRILSLAASAAVFAVIIIGIIVSMAQSSLPGDFLYPAKLLVEDVQLTLSSDPESLADQFAQLRMDEVKALMAIPRREHVHFVAMLTGRTDNGIIVDDLHLLMDETTPGYDDVLTTGLGSLLDIYALVTRGGQLRAESVTVLEAVEGGPVVLPDTEPTVTPTTESSDTPEPVVTAETFVTVTPESTAEALVEPTHTLTVTPSPEPASETPTETVSSTPSITESVTDEPDVTETPSKAPVIFATNTPDPAQGDSGEAESDTTKSDAASASETDPVQPANAESDECAVSPPDDWRPYNVREGDTLSSIAIKAGVSVAELMQVNCIDEGGFITVGQFIYVPLGTNNGNPQWGEPGTDGNPGQGGGINNNPDNNANPPSSQGKGNSDNPGQGNGSNGNDGQGNGGSGNNGQGNGGSGNNSQGSGNNGQGNGQNKNKD